MPARPGEPAERIVVRGCDFVARYVYDVPNHMWYEPAGAGLIRLGMTCVATALADNSIYAFTPKRVGQEVEKGRSCAVIESGKWVGPARIAMAGVVETVNEELIANPHWLVDEPYGKGWMMLVRPKLADAMSELTAGGAVAGAYEAWMDENDFPGCGAGRK